MLDFLIFAVTVVVALIVAVIYLYPGSRKVTTVPGLQPSSPTDGNLSDIARAGSFHEFLSQLHEDYGDIASFWWGSQLTVSVASPELFKQTSGMFDRPGLLFKAFESLITTESIQFKNGAKGRAFHSLMSSVYSHDMMTQYTPVLIKQTHELAAKLKTLPKEEHIPLRQYMFALALKMITKASFGQFFDDDREIVKFHRAYDKCMHEIERIAEGSPESQALKENQFQENKKQLVDSLKQAVALRKQKSARDDDKILLDVLIANSESEDDLYGNAITFLLGGFHASGVFLTWAIYFLASNPDIQEKVYNELVEVLGEEDLTNDAIKDLVYLQQVLNETLRCSQLGPTASRVQDFDGELGGHKLPAGTPVILAIGCLHHKEDLYPEPTKFDPERFSEENVKSRPSHAFEPFGFAGKRKCPGYRFSYTVDFVVLSVLLRKFKFELVPGQVVTQFYGFVTRPTEEIWVTLEKRK